MSGNRILFKLPKKNGDLRKKRIRGGYLDNFPQTHTPESIFSSLCTNSLLSVKLGDLSTLEAINLVKGQYFYFLDFFLFVHLWD